MSKTRMLINQLKHSIEDNIATIEKTKQVKVIGVSMLPHLNPFKIKSIYISKAIKYKIGDIIVFKNKESPIGISIHRIIVVLPKYVITKGDNNISMDKPIIRKDIIGKVEKLLENDKAIILNVRGSKIAAIISGVECCLTMLFGNDFTRKRHKYFLNSIEKCKTIQGYERE
ncbi:signal peptidase I [Clostridium sp.]|uniref:signal peptidase I n=1 Tax=Clostridium sp. TaxID=1506 RepID=UPI003F2A0DDF